MEDGGWRLRTIHLIPQPLLLKEKGRKNHTISSLAPLLSSRRGAGVRRILRMKRMDYTA